MVLQLAESPTPSSLSDKDTVAVLIPRERVGDVWHVLEAFVAKATAITKKTDIQTVSQAAASGDVQLWAVMDTREENAKPIAAVVTELAKYPNGFKSCQVMLAGGGEMRRWKHLIATLEEFARDEGCDTIEIVGRPGWGRLYPDYREIERWFEKEI